MTVAELIARLENLPEDAYVETTEDGDLRVVRPKGVAQGFEVLETIIL